MHRLTLAVAAFAAFLGAWAQTPEKLRLWTGDAPYAQGAEAADVPQITVYLPPEKPDGRATSAVLICPGGGYRRLCDSYEGHDLAKWLVARGVAGVVLTYRLAPKYDGRAIFADAKRAMRLVRTRAPGWRIDPTRLGAIGFSAGGHLAACLATLSDDGDPAASDPVERASCRPDFVGLVYPYLTMGAEYGHEHMRTHFLGKDYTPALVKRFSLDEQVTDRTPPAFVAHARTDQVVNVEHSRRFVAAMKKHGRPVEYHELATGVHGLGAGKGPEWEQWTEAFAAYLAK